MNNGAFTGDHSEQLEDIFKAIVKSEQITGKELTQKEFTDIRYDISQAYDEIINCFDKENADPSIVTYTINLMKSTIATTSDLRDISRIAASVSKSTIGALYLVNSLREREKERLEKLVLMGAVEENDRNINEITEDLTKKIDIDIDPAILDEISSDENERAYAELRQRAKNGDENAKIALSLTRKSANLIYKNKTGILNSNTKDIAALALVGKIVELGEDGVLLSANQLIREFDLERYDIYVLDENGNPSISTERLKVVLQKELEQKGMRTQAEKILGLDNEKQNIGVIEESNAAAEARSEDTLVNIHKGAKKNAELTTFRHKLGELKKYNKDGKSAEYEMLIMKFVKNNKKTAREYLENAIDFSNSHLPNNKLNHSIYTISEALKIVTKDKYITSYEDETTDNSVKIEEIIAKDNKKYSNYIDLDQIISPDDEER